MAPLVLPLQPGHRRPDRRSRRLTAGRSLGVLVGGLVLALAGNALTLVPALTPAARAATVDLPVADPGFEAVTLGDGGLGYVSPAWRGTTFPPGQYAFNPSSAYYASLAGRTETGTMTGQNVGLLYGSAPSPLQQSTGTAVVAGETYTVQVAVGGRSTTQKFSGLRLDLLVGGTSVASLTRATPPVPGSFGTVALTWTAPAAVTAGAVGLRISALAPSAAGYLDVDSVRLTAGTPPLLPIPVSVTAPTTRQIVQRQAGGLADVPVAGSAPGATAVQARLVARAGTPGTTTPWATLPVVPASGAFSGHVPAVPAGWYDVEVRAADGTVAEGTASVQRVGVGEVFLVAGQSNSSNWGQAPQTPGDERVSALKAGLVGWQLAQDPQPNADASKGSPWPAFGTRFVTTTGIPVGVVAVGVGATTVQQWQPGGSLYPRLAAAMKALGPKGFRAVLWHQGEWDASLCTPTATYATRLRSIIDASRTDAGFTVPWGVATASRLPGLSAACMTGIDTAQAQVVATTPAAFTGPNTNGYLAAGLTYDNIHFSVAGLTRHGEAWVTAVAAWGGVPAA